MEIGNKEDGAMTPDEIENSPLAQVFIEHLMKVYKKSKEEILHTLKVFEDSPVSESPKMPYNPTARPIVTFILPMHNEPHACLVSIGSLLCQTNKNWNAIIINNGPVKCCTSYIDIASIDSRVVFLETKEDTGTPITSRRLVRDMAFVQDFIVSASVQDYFHPNLVEEILKVADSADLILWNGMNHHYHDNVIHITRPEGYYVDWCNMAVRTEVARRFEIPDDRVGNYDADGLFAEAIMASGVRYVKIEKMLVVHT